MTDVADADSGEGEPDAEEAESAPETEDTPTDETADGENPPESGDAPAELVARVAAVDEEAAAAVAELREEVADLEAELAEREAELEARDEAVEELESKLTRARADFQNYKKRTKQREEEIRDRATEDLVERLLDVRDNLVRAVEQDEDVEVRDGVEATLATFDRVLDGENVSAIEPDVGGDVDPERHEVVHRTESDEPAGAIDQVYRPGYEMAGKVLRPAQVTVSEGSPEAAEDQDGGDEDVSADG